MHVYTYLFSIEKDMSHFYPHEVIEKMLDFCIGDMTNKTIGIYQCQMNPSNFYVK